MLKEININQYKNLKDIKLEFDMVNFIAGHNGTGKSSILHLISNGYRRPTNSSDIFNGTIDSCYPRSIDDLNLKIEKLTKGDDVYNNPAIGISGTLYSLVHDESNYSFRRHNSKMQNDNRFSLKLDYKHKENQKLLEKPIVYLGLKRLYPYGQVEEIKGTSKVFLSDDDQRWITNEYQKLTNLDITLKKSESLPHSKSRNRFETSNNGVDSNTISSGQDNIMTILQSVVVLKHYYENAKEKSKFYSMLLIDEVDATLHPALQISLLNKLQEYSKNFNIQLFVTTHSFHLLNEAFVQKNTVHYLIKAGDKVTLMDEPDMIKIEANLRNVSYKNLNKDIKIPVFIEDDEAKLLFTEIFKYNSEKYEQLSEVLDNIKFMDGSYSCEVIKNIFSEENTKLNFGMRAIGVVDGDTKLNYKSNDNAKCNLGNYLIKLVGNESPELEIIKCLYKNKDNEEFWSECYAKTGVTKEMSKEYLDQCENFINNNYDNKPREDNKKWWKNLLKNENDYLEFIIKTYIEENEEEIIEFLNKFILLYNKRATEYNKRKVNGI